MKHFIIEALYYIIPLLLIMFGAYLVGRAIEQTIEINSKMKSREAHLEELAADAGLDPWWTQ